MYNRYIPQPDGSYRRSRIDDTPPAQPPRDPQPPESCPPPPPPPKPAPPCKRPSNAPAGDFLRQLLPRDLDTGDLIVVLLLLLMAGDCPEDRNNALLTLAVYLLM